MEAYRYYRTAIIYAEEMSDELGYEEEERYFNVETYVRWYEAIEKALVIWLYYLGVRIDSGTRCGRVHRYHEAVLQSLSCPDNPFFRVFKRRDLLGCMRGDKQIRNKWRHDNLPAPSPFASWEDLVAYTGLVNDALEHALYVFSKKRVEMR